MVILPPGSAGAPASGAYLVDGTISGLSGYVNTRLLAANLTVKGDAVAVRTITFGQQVTNSDIVNFDVPSGNVKISNSAIMSVGATQQVTGVTTFNDGSLKLRNPGNSFSYRVRTSGIAADRDLTVPLLSADDTLVVAALAQTLTNKTLGTGTAFSESPTITAGKKFTFAPNATSAGLNIGGTATDPTTVVNGDVWYNSTENRWKYLENSVTYYLSAGNAGAPINATYLITSANSTLTAAVVVTALTAAFSLKGDAVATRAITIGQQVSNADTIVLDVPAANCTLNGVAVVNLSAAQTLTNKTLSTGTAVSASITFTSGVKQTFAPNATTTGLNFGAVAGDPSATANGDVWYNSTSNKFRCKENAVVVDLRAATGAGTTLDGAYNTGGGGAGRAITVNAGAVALTVPAAGNNRALDLVQNDTTNNPDGLGLANAGTGEHIKATTTNEDLRISANGTGLVNFGSHVKLRNQNQLRLYELTVNGSNYGGFKAAASLTVDTVWTLPTADGTNGQVIQTDGAGVLSFTTFSSSWAYDNFTGDGSTTAFTLSQTPQASNGVMVFLDGSAQKLTTDYTLSGTTLTFTTAPHGAAPTAAKVYVQYMYGGSTGTTHALLSATHTDTAAAAVLRGAIIVGNSTPNWSRLALGAADSAPVSNGTDLVYRTIFGDVTLPVNYNGSTWAETGDADEMAAAAGNVIKEGWDSTARRNFLHMEAADATLKTKLHVISWYAPWGWPGWATSSAVVVNFRTKTTLNTDNKLDVTLKKNDGTQIAQKTAQVSGTANTWTTAAFNFADFAASTAPAAGQRMIVELKFYSKSGNHVEVGEITLAKGANT